MLDLNSTILNSSKHGISLIFRNIFKGFGDFNHGTNMGAGSTKAGLEVGGGGRVETRKLLWRVWPTTGII
jgi:hypothetical protein